jgi:propanediol utilization protein
MREDNPRCPRPRKSGPDLGRVWVISDAVTILFSDASTRCATDFSGSNHLDTDAGRVAPLEMA